MLDKHSNLFAMSLVETIHFCNTRRKKLNRQGEQRQCCSFIFCAYGWLQKLSFVEVILRSSRV